jgi:ketosteroid isomerase-like protein
MTALEAFLDDVLPKLRVTETAIHDGDATPRKAMWSHHEPVTVFGAAMNARGWKEVDALFDALASRFTKCVSCEWEIVASDVRGDMGYVVAIERTTASVAGAEPSPYALRSTTIFRREDGEWKVVHRHGDAYDDAATTVLPRLTERDAQH